MTYWEGFKKQHLIINLQEKLKNEIVKAREKFFRTADKIISSVKIWNVYCAPQHKFVHGEYSFEITVENVGVDLL